MILQPMIHKLELTITELSLVILALHTLEVEKALKATQAFADYNLKALEAHLSSSEACTALATKLEEVIAAKIKEEATKN
jgi:hypothetical protein